MKINLYYCLIVNLNNSPGFCPGLVNRVFISDYFVV